MLTALTVLWVICTWGHSVVAVDKGTLGTPLGLGKRNVCQACWNPNIPSKNVSVFFKIGSVFFEVSLKIHDWSVSRCLPF